MAKHADEHADQHSHDTTLRLNAMLHRNNDRGAPGDAIGPGLRAHAKRAAQLRQVAGAAAAATATVSHGIQIAGAAGAAAPGAAPPQAGNPVVQV